MTLPANDSALVEGAVSEKAARMLKFLRWYARERINSRLMDERRSLPLALVSDFAAAGLLGLQVPERYQGQELSHVDTVRVITQLGAIDVNPCILTVVHNTLGIPPVRHFASESIKEEVLPLLAQGKSLITSAISEPGMGSHLRALATRATKNPDGSYSINGTKKWISLGADARYVNVFAQLYDGKGQASGITGFLVETDSPGFEIGPEMLTLGLKAIPQNDLRFNDLRVPPSALLGAEGEGLRAAKSAFMAGRVMLAAAARGAAMRSLEIACRFAMERKVATGRLAENGRIRQKLADGAAAIQAVQTLVRNIAERLDAGDVVPDALYFCAKILGCELMWRVIDTSVQVLAARGYLDTNVVGQHFRDYRLFRIFEGSTEAVTVYLGSTILRAPHEFFGMLDEQLDASRHVRELAAAVAELATTTTDRDEANRHILANVVGDLACWTMIAATTNAVAHRSAMHAYAASWCEQKLRDRLHTARHDLLCDLPSVAEMTDHIAGYADVIGDIEQHRPSEAYGLDPLLRRG
ncbi:acyl-CoA dehydrogenase family protein [Gandjariella thermophila]|nr:acyl-CoA dehydrogenase family protein [Gandjariella thermophila]